MFLSDISSVVKHYTNTSPHTTVGQWNEDEGASCQMKGKPCFVHKVQCVCQKTNSHTHKQQAWQGSLLTAWASPFHACVCMIYNVFLHLFWSYIISNTFRCVWTPAPFCCTLFWTCSVLPTYDMYFFFSLSTFCGSCSCCLRGLAIEQQQLAFTAFYQADDQWVHTLIVFNLQLS